MTWERLFGNLTFQAKRPAVANNQDGRLEVFAVGFWGMLFHTWQTAIAGHFSNWSDLSSVGPTYGRPAVGLNPHGELEVYIPGPDRTLTRRKQVAPNTGWGPWEDVIPDWQIDNLAATRGRGNQLIVASIVRSTQLAYYKLASPGWISFLPAYPVQDVFLLQRPSGLATVVMHAGDNSVWVADQIGAGGGVAPSTPLGGVITTGITPVAALNQDGRVEVFGRGQNGAIVHKWENPGGGWSGWAEMSPNLNFFWPTAMLRHDGRIEVIAQSLTQGGLWRSEQVAPNGSWTGWSPIATPFQVAGAPTIGTNADGRLTVVVRDQQGYIWHRRQQTIGVW